MKSLIPNPWLIIRLIDQDSTIGRLTKKTGFRTKTVMANLARLEEQDLIIKDKSVRPQRIKLTSTGREVQELIQRLKIALRSH